MLSTQEEVVGAMDDFLDLHTRSRADKTEFMTPEMETFFRRMASAMAAEGLIRLFMLRVNGKPAAAVLCFDAGSHLYLYNSGYDPEFSSLSVGLVSKALCLQWAIENGMTGLDFLRGDEPYKYDMGARDQEIYRIRLSRSLGNPCASPSSAFTPHPWRVPAEPRPAASTSTSSSSRDSSSRRGCSVDIFSRATQPGHAGGHRDRAGPAGRARRCRTGRAPAARGPVRPPRRVRSGVSDFAARDGVDLRPHP